MDRPNIVLFFGGCSSAVSYTHLVKAYLGGVARNKAKERLRKIGRETFLQDDALLIAPENPERSFEERDQARYIRRAILTMAPTQREIFFRYYYFYQPVGTIAREMDISPAAVKTPFSYTHLDVYKRQVFRGQPYH